MTYIDGFVAAVPTANRDAYRKHAEKAAPVFKEHGALNIVECWGDDVPDGKLTSFPMAVEKKDDGMRAQAGGDVDERVEEGAVAE